MVDSGDSSPTSVSSVSSVQQQLPPTQQITQQQLAQQTPTPLTNTGYMPRQLNSLDEQPILGKKEISLLVQNSLQDSNASCITVL